MCQVCEKPFRICQWGNTGFYINKMDNGEYRFKMEYEVIRHKYDLSSIISDLNLWDNYTILKIDISKLNITYWWDDASRGNTVYTVESIHPKFIKVIDNIDNV